MTLSPNISGRSLLNNSYMTLLDIFLRTSKHRTSFRTNRMWLKCVFACVYFMTLITLLIKGLPAGKKSKNDIIFPSSVEYEDDGPKCASQKTFCEDVENYPETKFFEILKNTTYEEEYFIPQKVLQEEAFKNRFYLETELYICNSHMRTLYPKAALNIKNEWKYVYNFDKFKQGVTTEECVGETTCTTFSGNPKKVRTKCVQKYSDILLLVADQDGQPVWDFFWFPSACVCAYEPIINFNRV